MIIPAWYWRNDHLRKLNSEIQNAPIYVIHYVAKSQSLSLKSSLLRIILFMVTVSKSEKLHIKISILNSQMWLMDCFRCLRSWRTFCILLKDVIHMLVVSCLIYPYKTSWMVDWGCVWKIIQKSNRFTFPKHWNWSRLHDCLIVHNHSLNHVILMN